MADFRITRFQVAGGSITAENRILARFDADVGPFRLRACFLVVNPVGKVAAFPPRTQNRSGSVHFIDRGDRDRFTAAALAAFRAMGGSLPADDA